MNVYITGDKHGNFYDLFEIQNRLNLFKKEDILIILGDSGFNYYVHKNMINNGRQYKCDRGNLYKKNFL